MTTKMYLFQWGKQCSSYKNIFFRVTGLQVKILPINPCSFHSGIRETLIIITWILCWTINFNKKIKSSHHLSSDTYKRRNFKSHISIFFTLIPISSSLPIPCFIHILVLKCFMVEFKSKSLWKHYVLQDVKKWKSIPLFTNWLEVCSNFLKTWRVWCPYRCHNT